MKPKLMEQSEHKFMAEFTLDIKDVKGSIRANNLHSLTFCKLCAH